MIGSHLSNNVERGPTACRGWSSALLAAMVLVSAGWLAGQSAPAPSAAALRHRMLVAEDARAVTPADLAPILEGLGYPDSRVAQIAVRALGRLERPEFIPQLRRALADSDSGVRAEAANALGQVAAGRTEAVQRVLRERLAVEDHQDVLGALYQTLGRLPFKSVDERLAVAPVLAEALGAGTSTVGVRLGASRGLESLIRGSRGSGFVMSLPALTVLRRAVVGVNRPGGGEDEARIRRAALTALNAAAVVDDTYSRAMFDADPQVRRLAIAGVAGQAGAALRGALVASGLTDRDPMVRYEALRVHARSMAAEDCTAQIAATNDGNPHVALLAIDNLASACPGDARATAALAAIAFVAPPAPVAAPPVRVKTATPPPPPAPPVPRRVSLDRAGNNWHRPVHAIVSLVRREPGAADWRPILEELARSGVWQVRMYVARAAEYVRDTGGESDPAATRTVLLKALATDSDANVREAAIAGLAKASGHGADAAYLKALERPDAQVVIAACRALAGTAARGAAADALLAALSAITAKHEDTSRDARVAILERLRETADPAHADALKPYLSDFDPAIAALTAEVLTRLTGQPHKAATTRATPLALPSAATIAALPQLMRVTMAGSRSFEVRLFVDDAPATIWRIVRLARAGYYNGLTFHRVVPNFVIQGGSPGANEFVGDGPFMRDETGLRSNTRGTIGVSTRGRDTGDAQFYINVVDSPRLDHEYAVFGEVVKGMDVVGLIVEGDVIKSVEFPVPRV